MKKEKSHNLTQIKHFFAISLLYYKDAEEEDICTDKLRPL